MNNEHKRKYGELLNSVLRECEIIFVCIYVYVVYICIYIYIYICLFVCVCICVWVYMCVCVCVYVYSPKSNFSLFEGELTKYNKINIVNKSFSK